MEDNSRSSLRPFQNFLAQCPRHQATNRAGRGKNKCLPLLHMQEQLPSVPVPHRQPSQSSPMPDTRACQALENFAKAGDGAQAPRAVALAYEAKGDIYFCHARLGLWPDAWDTAQESFEKAVVNYENYPPCRVRVVIKMSEWHIEKGLLETAGHLLKQAEEYSFAMDTTRDLPRRLQRTRSL